MLVKGERLNQILKLLPSKMNLINEAGQIDATLSALKKEWEELRQSEQNQPHDILSLLKEVEEVLKETIQLDEQNNRVIMPLFQTSSLPGYAEIKRTDSVRAVKAYQGG